LYVIGFIACGEGCTEAARLLGLLGLPNDTTMARRSFGIIEDRISNKVQELTTTLLLENLVEEAWLTMEASNAHDENDFQLWRASVLNPTGMVLSKKNKYPPLMCSFDMGYGMATKEQRQQIQLAIRTYSHGWSFHLQAYLLCYQV
jgi:hypothetical protein